MRFFVSIVLLLTQALYVNPTPPNPFGGADQRTLSVFTPDTTFPVLLQGSQVIMFYATPSVLFVIPNPTVGQAAVDACNAGKIPPTFGPGAVGPNCEFDRQPAIKADNLQRVNAAVMTITPAVLAANNLYLAAPHAK